MPNSIIGVNNLSKSYSISHEPVPVKRAGRALWEGLVILSCFAVKYNYTSTGSVQAPAQRHQGSFFE